MPHTVLVKNPFNGVATVEVEEGDTGVELREKVREILKLEDDFEIVHDRGEVVGGGVGVGGFPEGYVFSLRCEGMVTSGGWDSDAERFDEEVTTPDSYGSTKSVKVVRRGKKVGEGAYGWVYTGHYRGKPDDIVACKVLNVSAMKRVSTPGKITEGVPPLALREISTMKTCGVLGTHILPLIDVLQNSLKMPVLVVPKMDFDLSAVLRVKNKGFPAAAHRAISTATVTAVSHLHKNSIIHRDIKPANILLNKQGEVYLCDFGMSRTTDGTMSPPYSRMTLPYRPLECLLGMESYGLPVDMWSLGISLHEAWTGTHPLTNHHSEIPVMHEVLTLTGWPPTEEEWPGFSGLSALQLFRFEGIPESLTRSLPADTPPVVGSFVLSMLARSPYRRPTAEAMSRHEYLKGGEEEDVRELTEFLRED